MSLIQYFSKGHVIARPLPAVFTLSALLASLLLSACGGGAGDSKPPTAAAASTMAATREPNAPPITGNTATDGFNWFNYRRQQMGVQAVARNSVVDVAAQGHSNYQQRNNVITHVQSSSKPGFTGTTLSDRLAAAGYQFTSNQGLAYGEVISSTSDTSGMRAAEDLITAIYHRFVIFEPMFKEAGSGSATVTNGYTYFTTDFTANGLNSGLGAGKFVIYPFANQQNVPVNFFSDYELPDPVPNKNEVGYPISIHADITTQDIVVQSFTVQPRGGATMAVRLLSHATDEQTPTSVAAIVPLNVLAAATTYDVQFAGLIDGVPATRSWSFTTR
jgi:uncharacterized protein YkwD